MSFRPGDQDDDKSALPGKHKDIKVEKLFVAVVLLLLLILVNYTLFKIG